MSKLDQYKQLLKSFDWYYAFSDSYTTFSRGQSTRSDIMSLARQVDPDYVIFNSFAPDEMRVQGVPT